MRRRRIILILTFITVSFTFYRIAKKYNFNTDYEVGQRIDSLNGVIVYFNGGVDNTVGRNTSTDNYNIGLKYQCVEFVKRYYYQYLKHKMPDSYGHAKDFFDKTLSDGEINNKRALMQFTNGSAEKPTINDLIVFGGSLLNKYGHVAIISSVADNEVEIIQQNPGPFGKSRESYSLLKKNDRWHIDNDKVLGWLRKE